MEFLKTLIFCISIEAMLHCSYMLKFKVKLVSVFCLPKSYLFRAHIAVSEVHIFFTSVL